MMKQFSETIPTEILEAARIDGAGELRTFVEVVCPIIKPGFGALAIFTFINTWNDYFLQLIMLRSRANLTISLGIATLQAEYATNYGLQMAGAALGAVPIVLVFLMFQKYFTQGITMGAVFTVGLPGLGWKLQDQLTALMEFCLKSGWNCMAVFLLIGGFFTLISWLLVRNVNIRGWHK